MYVFSGQRQIRSGVILDIYFCIYDRNFKLYVITYYLKFISWMISTIKYDIYYVHLHNEYILFTQFIVISIFWSNIEFDYRIYFYLYYYLIILLVLSIIRRDFYVTIKSLLFTTVYHCF